MSGEDVIIKVGFDVKNDDAAKSVAKKVHDIDKSAKVETQAVSKNNKVWSRHIYTLRANEAQYKRLQNLFTKKSIGARFQLAGIDNSAFSKQLNEFNSKIDAAHRIAVSSSKTITKPQRALAVEEEKLLKEQRDQLLGTNFEHIYNQGGARASKVATQNDEKAVKQKAAKDKWYTNLRMASAKLEDQMKREVIARKNAHTNVLVSRQQGKAIPEGSVTTLTKGLSPEVAESYNNAWRGSKKLFGQVDHMKRWADGMHKVSMACLAANMSALGLFFSMFSVINLMKQGLMGLMGPLGDVGSMFESLAMSEAFGTGVEYDANKMVEAWEKFTGLKSDLSATMAVLGAEVLTDPKVWDSISSGVQTFMDELRKPKTIQAIKDLVIALANALPKIAKEIPGIADFITKSAPILTTLLPWAIKAAIAMPFLSIATGIASMTAALLRGIVALVRFRALHKSLGLVGALGGLAGGAGGIAGGLPVPIPGGGGKKKPKMPKAPKTSKIGRAINALFGVGIISMFADKLKAVIQPLTAFKDKIVNIVKPLATPSSLLRIGGAAFLGALSLVKPVGGGSEMTIGPNGEYIMGGQNITPSSVSSQLSSTITDKPVVEQQTINVNLYGNVTNENLDTVFNTLQNVKNYGSGI